VELRARGAILGPVICVIDRESGGAEKLAAEGLELHPLFLMHELKG
jgi:orotate phosphoribosyltransferase